MLGRRLRQLRLEKGLKAKELAEDLNISPPSVTNYERDERFPEPALLIRIAHYFDVSVDYLLSISNIRKYKDVIKMDTIDPELFNLLLDSKNYSPNQKYAIKAIIAGVKQVKE